MSIADPNAFLGSASAIVVLLTGLCIIIWGGVLLTLLSRIGRVNLLIPVAILLIYALVGTAAFYVLGPYSLSPDGNTYDRQAVAIAAQLNLETSTFFEEPLHSGKWGFPVLLGTVYAIVGRMPLAGVLLNCVVVSFTGIVVLGTARRLGGSYQPWFVVAAFLFSPAFITLGPSVMREALCWFAIALMAFCICSFLQGRDYHLVILLGVVSIGLLLAVRTSLGILVMGAAVCALLGAWCWGRLSTKGLAALVLVCLALALVAGDQVILLAGFDANTLMANRAYLSQSATTGFDVFAGPLELFGITGVMVATLPNIFLGPFPWDLGPELVWGWVLINSIFWWIAIWLVYRARLMFPEKRLYVALVIFSLVLIIGLAIYLTNYGILSRLRALPLIPMAIIISARFAPTTQGRLGVAS